MSERFDGWLLSEVTYKGRPAIAATQPDGEVVSIYEADNPHWGHLYVAGLAEIRARRERAPLARVAPERV